MTNENGVSVLDKNDVDDDGSVNDILPDHCHHLAKICFAPLVNTNAHKEE